MIRDLVVYGAGGMGQEVADIVLCANADGASWHLIGFVDDDADLHGREILGLEILGGSAWLADHPAAVSVALGASASRRRGREKVASMGRATFPALIHPEASVGTGSRCAEGSIVAAHATLTTGVEVGSFAIVNVGASVSHGGRLGSFATIAPGARIAGDVEVGEGADIGIGASVIQGLRIGSWSVVGAGGVVITEVDPDTTVLGCPARVVATREQGWHL